MSLLTHDAINHFLPPFLCMCLPDECWIRVFCALFSSLAMQVISGETEQSEYMKTIGRLRRVCRQWRDLVGTASCHNVEQQLLLRIKTSEYHLEKLELGRVTQRVQLHEKFRV